MSNLFKIEPSRIAELRKISDGLSMNDLLAVIVMHGARSLQDMDEDLLSCGELTPEDLPQGRECLERSIQMMVDMINEDDLTEVINSNDLGDYGLKVQKVTVTVGSVV